MHVDIKWYSFRASWMWASPGQHQSQLVAQTYFRILFVLQRFPRPMQPEMSLLLSERDQSSLLAASSPWWNEPSCLFSVPSNLSRRRIFGTTLIQFQHVRSQKNTVSPIGFMNFELAERPGSVAERNEIVCFANGFSAFSDRWLINASLRP